MNSNCHCLRRNISSNTHPGYYVYYPSYNYHVCLIQVSVILIFGFVYHIISLLDISRDQHSYVDAGIHIRSLPVVRRLDLQRDDLSFPGFALSRSPSCLGIEFKIIVEATFFKRLLVWGDSSIKDLFGRRNVG